MLALKKDEISLQEVDLMRDILFMFFPEYKNKSYEDLASILNLHFGKNNITGNMLFQIDQPTIEEDIEDLKLQLKFIYYGE
jgi:hypothetical protein